MKKRRNFIILIVFLTLILVLGYFLIVSYYNDIMSLADAAEYVRSFGIFGPIVFTGLQLIDLVYPFMPGIILTVSAGYVYGFFYGFLLVAFSTLFVHAILFILARKFGRTIIEKMVDKNRLSHMDSYLRNNSRLILIVARLIYVLPYNLVTIAAGLTKMTMLEFLIGTFIGTLPYFILFPYIGSVIAGMQINIYLSILFCIALFIAVWYFLRKLKIDTYKLGKK